MSLVAAVRGMMHGHAHIERSPASAEKDEAIAIARHALTSGQQLTGIEGRILARQLMRALGLSAEA
jgi:hypothetical protein